MGKRLPKKELLLEIAEERSRLIALVDSLRPRQFTSGELNDAGWTVKDVLTHLVDWEARTIDWYDAGCRGEVPTLPDNDFTWREIRALNDKIYRKHRRKSVKTVLSEFHQVHRRTLAAIGQMSNKELTTLGQYAWTGTSWTLSDYLRASTASHYRWATKKIRKWLREQEG